MTNPREQSLGFFKGCLKGGACLAAIFLSSHTIIVHVTLCYKEVCVYKR